MIFFPLLLRTIAGLNIFRCTDGFSIFSTFNEKQDKEYWSTESIVLLISVMLNSL